MTPVYVTCVRGFAYSTGFYRVSFCESRPTGSSSIMHTKNTENPCDLDLWPM